MNKNYYELKGEYVEFNKRFDELENIKIKFLPTIDLEKDEVVTPEEYENATKEIEELKKVYNQWKEEHDIFERCKIWGNELYGHYPWRDEYDYRDWCTDKETNDKVYKSIDETDKEDVAKFIENARKVLESVGYKPEEDYYELYDYLNQIEVINNDMRNGGLSDDNSHVLAMDILENRGLWIPYREGFADCIKKVAEEVDNVFLEYVNEKEE